MTHREGGQVSVMIVGFFIVIGLLAVVVVNSSAAFLQRQELNNVADGAALAAADALQQESVYANGLGAHAPVDPARASQIVREYLLTSGADVARWRVTADQSGIHVHLERLIDLALAPPGWRDSSRVTADATAQLRVPQ